MTFEIFLSIIMLFNSEKNIVLNEVQVFRKVPLPLAGSGIRWKSGALPKLYAHKPLICGLTGHWAFS